MSVFLEGENKNMQTCINKYKLKQELKPDFNKISLENNVPGVGDKTAELIV